MVNVDLHKKCDWDIISWVTLYHFMIVLGIPVFTLWLQKETASSLTLPSVKVSENRFSYIKLIFYTYVGEQNGDASLSHPCAIQY